MRIARAIVDSGETRFGAVLRRGDTEVFQVLDGDPLRGAASVSPTGAEHALDSVRLLAPVAAPGKIVGFGKNVTGAPRVTSWRDGAPVTFLKPSTAVVGPGEAVVLPRDAATVEPEAELAVVIGRRAHEIDAQTALEHVYGYTLVNDVTARDYMSDGHWTRAKGIDTFCPVGPWIETELDPGSVEVACRVNDDLVHAGSTADLVMDAASLIAYAAHHFTLEPGDLILTGSPPGRVPLRDGDVVEVSGTGIGSLRNPVVLAGEPHRRASERAGER